VGLIPHLDLQGHWTELHRTCFAKRGRNRCRTSNSPILNIFIRSKEIGRQTSKSTEIGPNFACFWSLKIFWEAPPKFRPGIIKLNILRSIVQNFAPIGPRSSEITRGEKKKKNIPQQNLSPLPQAIAYGRTNNGAFSKKKSLMRMFLMWFFHWLPVRRKILCFCWQPARKSGTGGQRNFFIIYFLSWRFMSNYPTTHKDKLTH